MSLSYAEFKKIAAGLAGVDLASYKSQQMDRRLHSLMHLWGVSDYDGFLAVLRTDPGRFGEFQKKITINVSEFFRNPERYEEMERVVLPDLFRGGRRLRIWSAGCANGAEPYSVAILIKKANYRPGAQIIATDLDRESLSRAQTGLYGPNELRSVPPDLLAEYFQREGGFYRLDPAIKRRVEFKHQNLLTAKPEEDCDLVLCRNVVIYLTEAAKEQLYVKLIGALSPHGYLMVGGTEPMLNFKEYGLVNPLTAFYRKDDREPSPGILKKQ